MIIICNKLNEGEKQIININLKNEKDFLFYFYELQSKIISG